MLLARSTHSGALGIDSLPRALVVGLATLDSVLTFLIVKACTQNPKLVWVTAGQFLAGR
jgi:hypothetical protein